LCLPLNKFTVSSQAQDIFIFHVELENDVCVTLIPNLIAMLMTHLGLNAEI